MTRFQTYYFSFSHLKRFGEKLVPFLLKNVIYLTYRVVLHLSAFLDLFWSKYADNVAFKLKLISHRYRSPAMDEQ